MQGRWVQKGSFQAAGAKPGFRSQKSEVRMKSICFPPSALYFLPITYCV